MRLDWYLPVIQRPDEKRPEKKRSWPVHLARKLLPKSWFSDWTTKRRGRLRQLLRKLGLSWLASPNRRIVQSLCFVAFLWLFFVVCWPYDAHPTRSWTGWNPREVDPETGAAVVVAEGPVDPQITARSSYFLIDASLGPQDSGEEGSLSSLLGEFTAAHEPDGALRLTPTRPLSEEQLASVLLSPGPWTLSERDPNAWPAHYAENLQRKEAVAAELFLVIDPLVSLSTGIASRSWVWSLVCAAIILAVCVLIPRGFCGYLCPLGTLIDLFDWSIGRRVKRFRVSGDGWWVHIKYYLLLAIAVAALLGVLVSGFFAAIPVITRGLLFTLAPVQNGFANGWHQVPPFGAGQIVSVVLFAAVLCLGFLRPRFWCKYVCPSGAVFSLGNLFRASERQVETSCIHCNKCVEVCPFDAIKPDFTTRTTDCTLCQTCAGVCPTHAIKFVGRWEHDDLKAENDPPTHETRLGRRGFLATTAGVVSGVLGGVAAATTSSLFAAGRESSGLPPVRPPGSVPEPQFLQMCIRCGECFKACPSDVLQPMGFDRLFQGLWTPEVIADWAGCASSCNACGQVCPTGAIRALPLDEKKAARMGLAIVNESTCLPFAGREACQLCVDECHAAGYHAIEFTAVGTEVDDQGNPIPDTGFLAPVVRADLCVGCGLCQTRCYGINVASKGLLEASAIVIEAGEGKEDRLMSGSYLDLREFERAAREASDPPAPLDENSYLPDFLRQPRPE